MKRIIILTISLILMMGCVFAKSKEDKMPVIKFNGEKYSLYYSLKGKETGGYLNEYYKKNQTYSVWTDLIALQHYPNAFYPNEQAKEFSDYLDGMNIKSEVTELEDGSSVMDFIVVNGKKRPIILEYNVFKFVKNPVCGTTGVQYAKRYRLNNGLEVERIKKKLAKERKKYVKQVCKLKVPEIVKTDIDKGQVASDEGVSDKHYQEFK